MVHVPKVSRNKWDQKSVKHILVGYDKTIKGYRCFNPLRKRVIVSRDVTIIEKANLALPNNNTNNSTNTVRDEVLSDGADSVGDENGHFI